MGTYHMPGTLLGFGEPLIPKNTEIIPQSRVQQLWFLDFLDPESLDMWIFTKLLSYSSLYDDDKLMVNGQRIF